MDRTADSVEHGCKHPTNDATFILLETGIIYKLHCALFDIIYYTFEKCEIYHQVATVHTFFCKNESMLHKPIGKKEYLAFNWLEEGNVSL